MIQVKPNDDSNKNIIPLSSGDETDEYNKSITVKFKQSHALNKLNYVIMRNEIDALKRDDAELSGDTVDVGMAMVQEDWPENVKNNTFILPHDFISALEGKKETTVYHRSIKDDIFKCNKIVTVIGGKYHHWQLVIFDLVLKEIQYFNSMKKGEADTILLRDETKLFKNWLIQNGVEGPIKPSGKPSPCQEGNLLCGIHSICMANHVVPGNEPNETAFDDEFVRQKKKDLLAFILAFDQ